MSDSAMYFVYLIFSLMFLSKAGDFFVKYSTRFSRVLNFSEFFVGLVVSSIATSFPEFSVSFLSALEGKNDISLGNVFGTVIANLTLGFGLALLVRNLPVSKNFLNSCAFMLLTAFLCILLSIKGRSSKVDGLLMLILFLLYLYFIFKSRYLISLEQNSKNIKNKTEIAKSTIGMIISVLGLFFSAKLVVWSAVNIALAYGISEHLISATIIATGTSLPEIVTSIIATHRRHYGISLGTIIGSNIADILFIIGFSSLFVDIIFSGAVILLDIFFYFLLSALTLLFMSTNQQLSRSEGVVLLFIFVIYLYFLLVLS